jgi:hypothetical protein
LADWITELIEAAPVEEQQACMDDVLEAAEQLGDDEVLMFGRSAIPAGTVVITSDRLIFRRRMGGDFDVTAYADVAQVRLSEGKKKRFGGYEPSSVTLFLRSDPEWVTYVMGSNWWAVEAGKSLATAYDEYTSNALPPQIPPTSSQRPAEPLH